MYDKNVRKYLGRKGKKNKGIAETLENNPHLFGIYNNGITIVAEKISKSSNNIDWTLSEPYIVNGCQTTRTIWDVLEPKLNAGETGTNPKIEDYKKKLKDGVVVTKIVVAPDEVLLTNTTNFTNSQNAISNKDFIALNKNFQEWGRIMAKKYNVFMEIQRGSWQAYKNSSEYRLERNKFNDGKSIVAAVDLLKVYGAGWLGKSGTAYAKTPPFAPGGTIYEDLMAEGNGFNVEDLWAAYRLMVESAKFFSKEARAGEGKAISRGKTRYLYYTIFMKLLVPAFRSVGITTPKHKDLTKLIIKMLEPNCRHLFDNFQNSAINMLDKYFTKTESNDMTIYKEDVFKRTGDLNGALKTDLAVITDKPTAFNKLLNVYETVISGAIGGANYTEQLTNIIREFETEEE